MKGLATSLWLNKRPRKRLWLELEEGQRMLCQSLASTHVNPDQSQWDDTLFVDKSKMKSINNLCSACHTFLLILFFTDYLGWMGLMFRKKSFMYMPGFGQPRTRISSYQEATEETTIDINVYRLQSLSLIYVP